MKPENYPTDTDQSIILNIKGIVDSELVKTFSTLKGLEEKNSIILFADYSDIDIELGQEFNLAKFSNGDEKSIKCKLDRITQQYDKVFDVVPKGWKTIVVLTFDGSIPVEMLNIPIVDGWYETEVNLSVKYLPNS